MFFKNRPENHETSVFLCFMNKNIYKHIGEKVYNACKCNNVSIYELPDMIKNMQSYESTLIKKELEMKNLLEISGKELTRILHDNVSVDGYSLKQHLLRISYL